MGRPGVVTTPLFARWAERVAQSARQHARGRATALAERAREVLPAGVGVETVDDGVDLTGSGLGRRLLPGAKLRRLVDDAIQTQAGVAK